MAEPQSPGLFDIREVLGARTPVVRLAVIGAGLLDGSADPHVRLIEKGLCTTIGFEPVAAECARLNRLRGPGHAYLPYCIGDGRRRVFHVTAWTPTSSLYRPNFALLRKFQNLAELIQVVRTEEVATTRLDDVAELGDVDYLHLDVQGAALDVFAGGGRTLAGAVVVHTEADFVPLYEGQGLFGDIDAALRGRGFLFHRFDGIVGRTFRPLVAQGDMNATLSQALWSDAVYVKDFTRLAELAPVKLLALAVILHEVYASVDLCAYVLHVHDRLAGSDLWAPYVTRLTGVPPDQRLVDD